MNRERAEEILRDEVNVWGVIRVITEADYGCEELPEGASIKDRVVIVTRDGEQIKEIDDQILLDHHLDEGSCITNELKESLF